MKEGVREQTVAARAFRGAGRLEYAKGELEQRRHWQREQAEKDRRIKESVRREKDAAAAAARSRRLGVDGNLDQTMKRDPYSAVIIFNASLYFAVGQHWSVFFLSLEPPSLPPSFSLFPSFLLGVAHKFHFVAPKNYPPRQCFGTTNPTTGKSTGKSMDFPEVLESIEFLCIIFFILFVLHRAQDFSQCLWTSRFFGVNSANPPKR